MAKGCKNTIIRFQTKKLIDASDNFAGFLYENKSFSDDDADVAANIVVDVDNIALDDVLVAVVADDAVVAANDVDVDDVAVHDVAVVFVADENINFSDNISDFVAASSVEVVAADDADVNNLSVNRIVSPLNFNAYYQNE